MPQDSQLSYIPPIPFRPDTTVAPYAVMESTGKEDSLGDIIVTTQQYSGTDPRRTILVNGPAQVTGGQVGECSLAIVLPVYVKSTGSIAAGASCGPVPGTWTVASGYPGFRAIDAASDGRVFAVREVKATIVKGLATSAVNGDATFTIDNVYAISGLQPVANTSATLTIQNTYGDSLDNNGHVTAYWDEHDNEWMCDNIECPA